MQVDCSRYRALLRTRICQGFKAGFMAYRQEEFNAYFLENYIALPLKKGDAVFFSPALFHAAGENKTKDFERSANLIQVSSAFGKPMESVDSLPLVEKSWDSLAEKYAEEGSFRLLLVLLLRDTHSQRTWTAGHLHRAEWLQRLSRIS
jgi:hypothetical protein